MNIESAPALRLPLGWNGGMSAREEALLGLAADQFPGGVLGGNALPDDCRFVFAEGLGSRFRDSSGNEYIDYVLGSGSLFLGHAHPGIVRAVTEQAGKGTHFFALLNEVAIEYGRRLKPLIRCAERLRFTTAGSDSTFHAMRMARAFTGREKILKFEGGYHGVHDYAQMSTTPSGTSNGPQPDTAGIPAAVQELTLVARWNDLDSVEAMFRAEGQNIAAVIMEPIQRILSPKPGFLHGVQEIARAHGALFILDEVVTGLRYGLKGAQEYFDITPDLATYGKVVGGGLPVGAVAGRADVLDQADPHQKGQPGYVYQNGTLQGHLLGCAAGIATIDILSEPGIYERTFTIADELRVGLKDIFTRNGLGVTVFGEGPMWHFLFTDRVPTTYQDIRKSDLAKLHQLETELIRRGIFILPNNRRFVSIAHDRADLAATFEVVEAVCKAVKG